MRLLCEESRLTFYSIKSKNTLSFTALKNGYKKPPRDGEKRATLMKRFTRETIWMITTRVHDGSTGDQSEVYVEITVSHVYSNYKKCVRTVMNYTYRSTAIVYI